jgi:hypothetical protein
MGLAVEYRSAAILRLEPAMIVAGRRVFVTLIPGVSDPSAPEGGMLYNRRGGALRK